MGAGASAATGHIINAMSEEELTGTLRAFSPRTREKLATMMQSIAAPARDDPAGQIRVDPMELFAQAGYSDLAGHPGCEIPEVEDRAITLQQLKGLMMHAERRLEFQEWPSTAPGSKQILTKAAVNLYDLTHYVLKPATAERKCAYVEVVAEGKQQASWFVSHWWGEPLVEFICCISQHKLDRQLPATCAYWVCAYANNQWQLSQDVSMDPAESSFRRAMARAEGTVSVLDRNAVVYTRVWCGYEIWISLVGETARPYQYDMYTALPGEELSAVGITDGEVAIDVHKSREAGINPVYGASVQKIKREQLFPTRLSENVLAVRVQDANASVDSDKVHILNSIVGSEDLSATPPQEHALYEKLNNTLRGRFVSATWRISVENGVAMDLFSKALAASPQGELILSFQGCTNFNDAALQMLARSLPYSLRTLTLALDDLGLTDAGVQELAKCLPAGLLNLKLQLNTNAWTDSSLESLADGIPKSLKSLCLMMNDVEAVRDDGVIALAEQMPPQLENLDMHFFRCRELTDRTATAIGEACPRTLRRLFLAFNTTPKVTHAGMRAVMQSIANADALKDLTLHLNGCQLTDETMTDLAEALPRGLSRLVLWLGGCNGITDRGVEALAGKVRSDMTHMEIRLPQGISTSAKQTLKQACRKSYVQ